MEKDLVKQIPEINYERIAKAKYYYASLGFRYIETPWIVTEEADSVTRPSDASALQTPWGNLPASGEQSFIDLSLSEYIPKGMFQTITPCFRDESVFDKLHQPWFIKLELINTQDVTPVEVKATAYTAKQFFEEYANIRAEVIKTGEDRYDVINSASQRELGSYNKKKYKDLEWVCGTGLAEPRTSQIIKRNV